MSTLTLKEAAALLHMNPASLRRLAVAGRVPAAKPAKCWLFIEADLLAWIRAGYAPSRQVPEGQEVTRWHCLKDVTQVSGGSASSSRGGRYADLLGLPTRPPRSNTKRR
jgi:hypothetical protein